MKALLLVFLLCWSFRGHECKHISAKGSEAGSDAVFMQLLSRRRLSLQLFRRNGMSKRVAKSSDAKSSDKGVKKVWEQLTPSGGPPARYGHTAVSAGDKMLVFGGDDGGYKNDLWEYSMKNNTWEQLKHTGALPPARSDHTAVSAGDKMLVFGGWDGKEHNDLWEYDIKINTWKQLNSTIGGPPARSGHTAVSAGDKMLVFGGESRRGKAKVDELRE